MSQKNIKKLSIYSNRWICKTKSNMVCQRA